MIAEPPAAETPQRLIDKVIRYNPTADTEMLQLAPSARLAAGS